MSGMHHHGIGEPHANKHQYAGENKSNGIHHHAMPILVVAFRAFVFCEIRDRRVVPSGLMDRRIAPTTPVRTKAMAFIIMRCQYSSSLSGHSYFARSGTGE